MLQLPLEVLVWIVGFLETQKGDPQPYSSKPRLSPYATVNKKWQHAVEVVLFHRLSVSSEEHDYFLSLFSGASVGRKAYLRSIRYSVTWESQALELDEAQEQHNMLFSSEMCRLYTLLADWDSPTLKKVRITIQHPDNEEDPDYRGNYPYLYFRPEVFQHQKPIPFIEDLCFCADVARLWPGSLLPLVAPFCAITRLTTMFHDLERKDRSLRKEARKTLALQIPSLPSTMLHLDLVLTYETPIFHGFHAPSLLCDEIDIFSRNIRHRMSQLRVLTLCVGQLSAELFWPQPGLDGEYTSDSKSEMAEIHFPHLEELFIQTSLNTASSSWLLIRDPDKRPISTASSSSFALDSEEEDHYAIGHAPGIRFRNVPHQAALDALNLSLVRACQRMPKLQSVGVMFMPFEVKCNHPLCSFYFVQAGYLPYESGGMEFPAKAMGFPRVQWWAAENKYEPSEEIKDCWREKAGAELSIEIIPRSRRGNT